MRRSVTVSSWVIGLVLAACAVAGPARAVGGFGPPVTIGCGGSGQVVPSDSAIAVDGTVRGFTNATACPGSGTGSGTGPLSFFAVSPAGVVTRVASPYSGRVVQVAWDGQGATYVVFVDRTSLFIGKHLDSGAFSPVTTLSSTVVPHPAPSGSLIGDCPATVTATAGHWWAVWVEGTSHGQLFGAHTLLGHAGRTQITSLPAGVSDCGPELAQRPGQVTLVWSRRATHQTSVLRLATTTGGAWHPSTLTGGGTSNYAPSMVIYDGSTYVSWIRTNDSKELDAVVMFASNHSTGSRFTPAVVFGCCPGAGETRTSVAVSGSAAFVAWNSFVDGGVAERVGGAWTGLLQNFDNIYRVTAQGGKASLLYQPPSALDTVGLARQ